ncbi:MAG: hypothetical protein NZM00_11060 [Anaerolinea sp.]|nr:hypothetical protein [Anaerolinea sp.]
MTPPPNPMQQQLTRALVLGAIAAIAAVLLFIVVWLALEDAEPAIRLFSALCLPPGVLAIIIGAYILVVRPKPQ